MIWLKELLANLIINEVYSITTMYNEKGTCTKRINRPCWALLLRYEGETIYHQKGKQIVSNIYSPVILPKGSDYDWQCTETGHYIIIEFQSNSNCRQIISFSIKQPDKLLSYFKKAESKWLLKNDLYKMESIVDTYRIILYLNEQESFGYVSSDKKTALAPAIEHITKNFSNHITNDSLAALTGFSTVYFRKLFKEVYGTSPIEYIKELKIKKAKEMLHSDYGSITEISISLGYQNIYDFSRDFKKRVGVSPSNYLR